MSESFTESVILLLLTAGLTGLLVPIIKGIVDDRTFRRQKRYEAELTRQGKIIEAQSQFLDDISQQLWRFRYHAMAVSYYRPDQQPEQYKEAVNQYEKESWDIFNNIRANISKARRLISESAYDHLVTFYKESW